MIKFLTAAMIEATMDQLRKIHFDVFTRVELSEPSLDGRKIHAIRLADGTRTNRRGFLMVGGMHGRELMNPDAIVELLIDLVVAYKNQQSLSYGDRTWTWAELANIIQTLDIWAIPCANPDGRARSMTVDWMWRKNARNTVDPGNCPPPFDAKRDLDGVDINRNFDVAWGITGPLTSCNPCSDGYLGPQPHSEPETRNIVAFGESHRIDTFVDVHSYSNWVLYPWGHAGTQTNDPSKSFTTLASATCQPLTPSTYHEYMRGKDVLRYQTVANRVLDAIERATPPALPLERDWTAKTVFGVYNGTTSGSSTDYFYSRHLADPSRRKTYAFALETGPNLGMWKERESFQPNDDIARATVKGETKAALLTLMEQTVCGIDFIGTAVVDRAEIVEAMTDIRDDGLARTAPGRDWLDLFDRIHGPLLSEILSDDTLMHEATELFKAAAALIDDEGAVISDDLIARARTFLRAAAKRQPKAIAGRDLKAIDARLAGAEGKTLTQVVGDLGRTGPGQSGAKKVKPKKRR